MLQVVVLPLRVNVNLKAVTVEELIGRRKVLVLEFSHALETPAAVFLCGNASVWKTDSS